MHPRNPTTGRIVAGMLAACLACGAARAQGQSIRPTKVYHPLDQYTPTGTAGHWSLIAGKANCGGCQAVQVLLPKSGTVTFYAQGRVLAYAAPAQVTLSVGHVYRFRVGELEDYPGLELYPSIELIDRLHPPPGREHEFPIPVALTEEEITAAALSDPDNPPLTDEELAQMRPVPIPPRIREELGMTPLDFAEAFDLPLDAVLTWEAYGTVVDLTAIAYLRVIEQDPEMVKAALAKSRQKTS